MIWHCRLWSWGLAPVLVALWLALVPSGPARAETPIWTQKTSGDLSTLSYGSLDPQKIPILLLSCFNEMEVAVLDVHQEIKDGPPGEVIAIEFSSAKAQAPLQGEIAKNRDTGKTFGEASDIKVKPILEVLRDPGPVTLAVGEASLTLSDAGREQAVSDFAKACTLN